MKTNIKSNNNFFRSFSFISLFTFLSRVLGYIRDLFFAFLLGATPSADSFLLAFRIPNFFRRLFAEGAINNALIPIYLSISEKKNKKEAQIFSGTILLFLFLLLIIVLIAGLFFMLDLVKILAPNFSLDLQLKTAYLASIMFPYLLFISLSSFFGAILNAKKHFLMWAFLPVILNFCMLLGMLYALQNSLDVTLILSVSVLLAGVLQFILIYIWTRHLKISFILKKPKYSDDIKNFFKLLLPNLMAGGVVQINQFVGVIFAASIPGAISWLYYADRIVQLPLGVFIISISTILLTSLSNEKVKKQSEKINIQIEKSLEIMMGISLLSCVGLFALSDLIVDILFRRGQFGYGDVKATSDAIWMYALGLPAFGLIKIFSTIFFSEQDTKTPFRVSFLAMLLNIFFITFLIDSKGHLGIALALSISSWFNAIALYFVLHLKGYWKINFIYFKKLVKLFFVFFLTLNIVQGIQYFFTFFDVVSTSSILNKLLFLVYMVIISISTFILFCILFRILSLKDLSLKKIFNKLRRN